MDPPISKPKISQSGFMITTALWMFRGAYSVGQTIRILEGPLKEQQGNIVKVDKRNRNCLISLEFIDNVFKVWLAFDLIETCV